MAKVYILNSYPTTLTHVWFTYPVDGYLPLQNPPTADLLKAHKLLGYIKNVLSTSMDLQVENCFKDKSG